MRYVQCSEGVGGGGEEGNVALLNRVDSRCLYHRSPIQRILHRRWRKATRTLLSLCHHIATCKFKERGFLFFFITHVTTCRYLDVKSRPLHVAQRVSLVFKFCRWYNYWSGLVLISRSIELQAQRCSRRRRPSWILDPRSRFFHERARYYHSGAKLGRRSGWVSW